ncbi:response regulator transcription factor [Streptomyces sp. H10-C2]|uniref:response regulator transcription factor n=1 Tax=unclassified Streptomyces TaxID=2593676 RepID=UPI0024B8F148|nr:MULTISPECIES: response regulator transcription factor [unclassified Streptomyces]MDJ0347031.1 response regulator transcription factor [Streptomyces sp. PH10-H1]MDJ0375299.1 response regulator transcription factor [Streptomyces sp. H10-C2]
MIRVLWVHDSQLMRSALAALLDDQRDMQAVTSCWENAVARARALRPNVCVVDGDCPGASRLPTRPAQPCCALLVLTRQFRPGVMRRATEARALGFVDKDAPPSTLLGAIRQVAAGERYVDKSLAFDVLQATEIPLSPRELRVLSLAADGASVPEIAEILCLREGTVGNYMTAITRKTGARNRVDAIRISQEAGWV